MKLTTQDIQFIDTYLTNSGVFYADIRMEMLDHVATAVEKKMEDEDLEFYDAFKDYMVINKKIILKNNREGYNLLDTKTYKEFGRFLLKPLSVLSLPIISGLIFLFTGFIPQVLFHNYYFGFILFSCLLILIGFYIYRKIFWNGQRFFVVEQSGVLFLFFILLQNMNPFIINLDQEVVTSRWFYGIFFYLFFNTIGFQIYTILKNKKKLHEIAA